MTDVDFGRRSDDYAKYRPGFPDSLYDRLERLIPLDGVDALDLGTGPGTVALELAQRGACVTGLDISANQIESARHAAASRGLEQCVRFVVGRAEEIDLPGDSFDLVTAGQCWVWFERDVVLGEVIRLLRPGGPLVVAHSCYLPTRSRIASETERLILKHNPAWTMAGCDGLYPEQVDELQHGGLRLVEQFCYDHGQPFSHEAWRGRIRTCNGVGSGVLTDEQVATFDAELAGMWQDQFPPGPLMIPHRVWAVAVRTPEKATR